MQKRKSVFRPAPFLRPPLLLAAAALVSAMVFAAQATGMEAVIFPEIAALAFGAWGTRARPWMATNFDLFLSPTLAALTGWLVINYVPGPLALQAGCSFVLVLLELRLAGSAVLPSISAAILPLVAGESGIVYPAAVGVFTAVIALVCCLLDWTGHGNYTKIRPERTVLPQRRQIPALLFRWGRVLAITLACAALSGYTGRTYLLAPPLIIACLEFVNPGGPFRKRPFSLYLLVVLGGCAGSGAAWLAGQGWLPAFAAAGLAVCFVFLLFQILNMPCPPAAALSVLPFIVPQPRLTDYCIDLAAGAALFFILGALLFPVYGEKSRQALNKNEPARVPVRTEKNPNGRPVKK